MTAFLVGVLFVITSKAQSVFLLESDAHRNMSFAICHCYHTPKLNVDTIKEKDPGDGLKEITVIISNSRLMPTHSSQDLKYKIERPDYIPRTGVKVMAGMFVDIPDLNITTEQKKPILLRLPYVIFRDWDM
jgi:hypothetical protein